MIRKYIIVAEDSIKGFDEEVAKLEREWGVEEIESSEDCISRELLLKHLENITMDTNSDHYECKDKWYQANGFNLCKVGIEMYVKNLPSVKPQRPSGKWVNNIHDIPICDQCGYMTPYDRAIDDYEYGNFCPNCGAKMGVEE